MPVNVICNCFAIGDAYCRSTRFPGIASRVDENLEFAFAVSAAFSLN
jgi:hypothetical protein